MPEAGFEPARRQAYAPQTYVSANSTTPAFLNYIKLCQTVNNGKIGLT